MNVIEILVHVFVFVVFFLLGERFALRFIAAKTLMLSDNYSEALTTLQSRGAKEKPAAYEGVLIWNGEPYALTDDGEIEWSETL